MIGRATPIVDFPQGLSFVYPAIENYTGISNTFGLAYPKNIKQSNTFLWTTLFLNDDKCLSEILVYHFVTGGDLETRPDSCGGWDSGCVCFYCEQMKTLCCSLALCICGAGGGAQFCSGP